jgi:radical SAM protein with 4Fe4S-binding SPASM domain
MCDALVTPGGHTFVTLSLDGVTPEEYVKRHGLRGDRRDGVGSASGGAYFDLVREGLARLRTARDVAGSQTEIRGAFLLFDDNAHEATIEAAMELYGPHVDLLRFALPQYRNDGCSPGDLPSDSKGRLAQLKERFRSEPKIRILSQTATPTRDSCFKQCWAQRFQVVIDKTGNVFPCPQVAVAPHRRLSFGNIRSTRLADLMIGKARADMFGLDVDAEMKCRICDRKDEVLNITLARLAEVYGAVT